MDALDELPELVRDGFTEHLAKVQSQIRLLITSRYNIEPMIDFTNGNRLDIIASWEDVKLYMKAEIGKSRRLKKLIAADPSVEGEILDGVNRMARGVFLLANLQIQSLSKQHSVEGVRNALRKSPQIVLDQYNEAMERVRDQDHADTELAFKLLSLVYYATRPLTIDEVCCALAIRPGVRKFDEEAVPDIDIALSVAVGLVRVFFFNDKGTTEIFTA